MSHLLMLHLLQHLAEALTSIAIISSDVTSSDVTSSDVTSSDVTSSATSCRSAYIHRNVTSSDVIFSDVTSSDVICSATTCRTSIAMTFSEVHLLMSHLLKHPADALTSSTMTSFHPHLLMLQPIADRVALNLEIVSKNFRCSTKRTQILMGFITNYLVLIVNPLVR